MAFFKLSSYVQIGVSGAFKFILFPLNMIRRFSYSFFAILTNRLMSQRRIQDSTTAPAVSITIPTLAFKEQCDPSVTNSSIQTQTVIVSSMNHNHNTDHAIINLEDHNDDTKTISTIIHTTTPYKRPSIPQEIEEYLAAAKKSKLESELNQLKTETLSIEAENNVEIETIVIPGFEIENQTLEKKLEVKTKLLNSDERIESLVISQDTFTPDSHRSNSKVKIPKGRNKKILVEKPRLNYFVGIQVNSSEVRKKIKFLQENMLAMASTIPTFNRKGKRIYGNIYDDAMIPVGKLHFTLHVVHLKDDEDIEKAKDVVKNVCLKFKKEFEKCPMVLKIQGVGHFRNNVIFAKLDGEICVQQLSAFADIMRVEFNAANIIGETRQFKPHMTIAKISKSKTLPRFNIRTFPPEIWSCSQEEDFGLQDVKEVQLLSMQGDDSTGYYKLISRFPLEEEKTVSPADDET